MNKTKAGLLTQAKIDKRRSMQKGSRFNYNFDEWRLYSHNGAYPESGELDQASEARG